MAEASEAFAPNVAASDTSLALETSYLLHLAGQPVSKNLLNTLFRVSGSRADPGLYSIERGYVRTAMGGMTGYSPAEEFGRVVRVVEVGAPRPIWWKRYRQ